MCKLFFPLPFLIFICCRQSSIVKEHVSLKDSVLKKHFAMIDSLDFYDTANQDYRMLRAYINNDTVFFANMKREMDMQSQYLYPAGLDSCVFPKKISELQVDEAYRFIHSQSFCDFGQAITISRIENSIKLHYTEYILPDCDGQTKEITFKNGTHYYVKSNCVQIKEFTKSLKEEDWYKLESAINNADYWGLKQHNARIMVDGSSWQVDAYTKQPRYPGNQQIHSVSRQSPSLKAFRELGMLFMKLSGEKTMCGDLN
jgi:hypothetical protein